MNYQIEILSTPELLALPEPEWLIEGQIHQQEMGVLYGPPNAGKSFVALDWALSVASGIPWLGVYPTKRTPVLYMAGEGGASLQKRVEAWMGFHEEPHPLIYFQCRPIPVLEDEAIASLREALAEMQFGEGEEPGLEPGLIIVDTLSQFIGAGDENGPEMAAFVANLRYLSQDQNSAVVIVHHTNKGGEQERGHSALRGNVDVMFSVKGQKRNYVLSSIELLNDKQRDEAQAKPLNIGVEMYNKSLVLFAQCATKLPGLVVALSSDSLVNLLLACSTVEDVSKEVVQSEDWLEASCLNRSTYTWQRNKLLRLKLIRGAGHGKYAFTPAGRETMYYYRKGGKKVVR